MGTIHALNLRSFTLTATSRLLEVLREDNRAIVRAASAASKAAEFILGFQPGVDQQLKVTSADGEREAA